ncbi:MAG: hypothetical protein SVR81_07335 [Chloroflexota bacterium]|nr:hypothetical protein [Chloroflexota bacterium]
MKICESQVYRFPSDVVAGQLERVVVLVTFDEMFGIPETVRYDITSIPVHSKLGQNPASKISSESAKVSVSETAQTTSQPGEESDLPLYEVISLESIRAENSVLIELNAATIEIHPVMGTLFRLGFRYTGITKDQIPESRAGYIDSPFITDLQLFRGEDETPIRLDVLDGGGGQGITDDGLPIFNQSHTYQFPPDMVVGQEEHIVVLVGFHEIFGIDETVRYEFDLVPLQGPLG